MRRLLLPSLDGYRPACLGVDLIAGVTLLAIAVPEQLATSRLAGMPAMTGLYAFIAGTAAFALLGTNPQLSVGADSTIAPLFAVGVGRIAPTGSTRYVHLVGILAVMVGILVMLVGAARLGWLAEFLSLPIITGFLAGVALVVVVRQLPDLVGLPAAEGSNLHRIGFVVRHLADVNGWSVGIGLAVLGLIFAFEAISRRFPGALLGMVISSAVVAGAKLHSHGVAVLGLVSHNVPSFGLTDLSWSALGRLAPIAGVVALVVLSQSAATTRAFADRGGFAIDVNKDFVGIGAGGVLAGVAGTFPVNASPARTAVLSSASARSQVAGLIAAGSIVVLLPAAGLLKDVPLAALAGTLFYVASRLIRVHDIVAIARFSAFELGLTLETLFTVLLVGVEQGIGVAVGLAILDRTRLSARPNVHVLGRIPGSTSWAPRSDPRATEQVDGVLVVLFATPLWYANANHFRVQFLKAVATVGRPVKLVVLDALGMSDVDYTGALALKAATDYLAREHIEFAIARVGEHARENLDRSALLEQIGVDHFFPSVGEAVDALAGA